MNVSEMIYTTFALSFWERELLLASFASLTTAGEG